MIPLAAVIDDRVLCVHGGLSPEVKTLSEINNINRKIEVPNKGAMCDLMWSDPDGKFNVYLEDVSNWTISPRGAGFLFGEAQTKEFNLKNGIQLICRSH